MKWQQFSLPYMMRLLEYAGTVIKCRLVVWIRYQNRTLWLPVIWDWREILSGKRGQEISLG